MYFRFVELTLLVLSGSLIFTKGSDNENCKGQNEDKCTSQSNDDLDEMRTPIAQNSKDLLTIKQSSGNVIRTTSGLYPTSTMSPNSVKSSTLSPTSSTGAFGTLSMVTVSTINTRAVTNDSSISRNGHHSVSSKGMYSSGVPLRSKWSRSNSRTSSLSATSGITPTSSTSWTSVVTRTASVVTTEIITTKPSSSTLVKHGTTRSVITPTKSSDESHPLSETQSVFCTRSRTGSLEDRGLLMWNKTKINTTSQQQCPNGPPGVNALRECLTVKSLPKWGAVNDTKCNKWPKCSATTTGLHFQKGTFNWPETAAKTRVNVSCPYQRELIAYRSCKWNKSDMKAYWDVIHNENCPVLQKNMTMKQLIEMNLTQENEMKVAVLMNYLTSHSNFSVTVVKNGADLLKKLVDEANDLFKIRKDLLSSVSNVMNGSSTVITEAQNKHSSAKTILTSMGKMMKNVKLNSKSAPSRTNTTHVIGEARDIVNLANEQRFEIKEPNKSGKSRQDSDTSVSIRLPSSLLKDYNATRVYFFNFKNDKLFPHKGNRTNKFINSEIVSASIKDREVRNLSDPVVIEFKLTDKNYSRNGSCVYWDFKANSGYGGWSKDGCSLETIDDSRVRCRCTHLTNFGILVDLFPNTEPEGVHRVFLERLTFIGCYLSIVGLVLSMLMLISFKKYRTGISGKILFNLCLALLFSLVVFIIGIERVENESICVAMGALLHYFVLVAIFWMGVEAFHMFLNIVMDRLPGELGNPFVLKCAALAWVLPMLVVMTTVLVKTDDYKGQSFCRVSGHSFYIAFLAPILTILLINLIIFILVIKSLLTNTVPNDRRSLNLIHFRRVLGIMTVFGITWIFGVLAVGKVRIVFQYLFCITNSFQGFMIFVIYCMTDRSVRERLVRLLCVLPEPGMNRVIDSSSIQRSTDIQIQMSDFESNSLHKESEEHPNNRGEYWPGSWTVPTSELANHPWAIPEQPIDSPYIYYPPPGSRPRVNVPLSDEPGPGIDKLVEATFMQLEHSGGETSLRSADGSVIFINNGRIVDVPRPSDALVESSRSVMDKEINQDRKPGMRPDKILVSPENPEDLKRWSEMEWLPKLKCYSQTLPGDFKDDDELDEINFNHFQSQPKRYGLTEGRRQGSRIQKSVRIMADDKVEHAYYEKCREEYGNADDSGPNSLAAAGGSPSVSSTSNTQSQRQKTEMPINEKIRPNSSSTESDTSSISSLRWSEADWLPSLKSYSQSTSGDLNSDDERGKTNMPHFQEL